jgi:hypothetical protein
VSGLTLLLAAALAALPLQQAQDQRDEAALKLVQRIRQDLAEVDRLLDEAAATDRLGPVQDARASHVRAISDLEELIRLVKYQRSGNPSSGGGGGGKSPQGQAPPRESDDRSQAEPSPQPQQPQDGPQGEERSGSQPRAAPEQSQPGAQEQSGQLPPPDPTADFLRRDTDARWGVLPPKLQERLMNLHVDDVPQRYRAWLEAYVRELNRREGGAGGP